MTPKHFFIRLLSVMLAVCLLPVISFADGQSDTAADRSPVACGIDVSRWQGEVDFGAVKESGIDFVILRVGYWDVKDANFDTYYDGARDAGLDIGVYLYSYSESVADAELEAKSVLSWLDGRTLEYPVYYDIEDECQSELSNEARTELCLGFARVISEAGYLPGVYANENWFNNYLVRDSLSHLPLWLAKWTEDASASPDPGEPYGMWQYTDKGQVNGIKYGVDMNVCYEDYPAYIKEQGLNGYGTEPLPFTDVKEKAWYYEYVRYTYERGLFGGMSLTSFAPEVSMTRGMFVTVLGRMNGVDTALYTESMFLDVDMTRYYGPYVDWAYENGIADGVGRDLFAPDELITREQMCKMIAGYATLCGTDLTPSDVPFEDDGNISAWAKEYVYQLAGSGIVNGVRPGVFSPDTNATRAQCAAIITRLTQFGVNDATEEY